MLADAPDGGADMDWTDTGDEFEALQRPLLEALAAEEAVPGGAQSNAVQQRHHPISSGQRLSVVERRSGRKRGQCNTRLYYTTFAVLAGGFVLQNLTGWGDTLIPGHRLHRARRHDSAAIAALGYEEDLPAGFPTKSYGIHVDGHVVPAAWKPRAVYAVPLPTLAERRRFPAPDFGACEPFSVPNAEVYGMRRPTLSQRESAESVGLGDHLGAVISGQVFVRCKRGWELRPGISPERACMVDPAVLDPQLLSSGPLAHWSDINVISTPASHGSLCVEAVPAQIIRTKSFEEHRHLSCLSRLVRMHPEPGAPNPDEIEGQKHIKTDHRKAALKCFGCKAPPTTSKSGQVDFDCSPAGRIYELKDVTCSRQEILGDIGGGEICLTPSIVAAPAHEPCTVLTVGVGYIWETETDLTSRFNCTTVMFDPTPGSGLGVVNRKLGPVRDWIPGGYRFQFDRSMQHRPLGNYMDHVGIATEDKRAEMENSQQFGFFKGQELEFLTIGSMLRRAGLDSRQVALFKLDVEGYEFGVLDQVLEQRFRYINIDFHTWDHVQVSAAMHSFANAGYRIVGFDTARLDDRPDYGMLIHMEFVLLRESSTSSASTSDYMYSDEFSWAAPVALLVLVLVLASVWFKQRVAFKCWMWQT